MALSLLRRGDDMPLFDPFSFGFESIIPRGIFDSNVVRDVATSVMNAQVDWREAPESHIFKVNLPGMRKEDIKVQVEDGRVLQISGERKKEEAEESDRWHRVERAYGTFVRRFRLPENAKMDDIKATMENGVLTIVVPKAQEGKAESKSIEIAGSS